MGLFGSSDPTVKQEKLITKEAKNDEKALKSAIKHVSSTEKDERNALKAKHSANENHDKAVKAEQKLREELTKLTSKHEAAVAHVKAMEKEVASKTEAHQRAYDLSHKTKGDLEALQKENAGHDAERRRRLDQLHSPVGAVAGGDGVLRDAQGNPAHGPDARGISPLPGSDVGSAVHSNVGSGVAPAAAVGAGAGAVGAGAIAHEQHQHVQAQQPQLAQQVPQMQQPALPPRNDTQPQAPAVQTNAVAPTAGTPQQYASPTSTTASAPGAGFPPPPSHPSTAGSAPGSSVGSPAVATGPSAAAAPQIHPQAVETLAQPQAQSTTSGQQVADAVKAM